jgi:hypothetical protein
MAIGVSPAVVSQLSDVLPSQAARMDAALFRNHSYSHITPATTASSWRRIGAWLRWLAALCAGVGTAGQVVVVQHHGETTWAPGARHSRCTDISLSERGRLPGRLLGQRFAGRRPAQLTSSRVWGAEVRDLVGYREAADKVSGECTDGGCEDYRGGAAENPRDGFGWVAR